MITTEPLIKASEKTAPVGLRSPTVRPKVDIRKAVLLTKAQAKSSYVWTGTYRNAKPVFQVPARKVITHKSAFRHKGLCDGPTFSLGLSCFYSCLFCYVSSLLGRNSSVLRIMKETGLAFDQIAIERGNSLAVLQAELVRQDGRSKFPDPSDKRVIFASPLVDVAANLATAQQTVAACRLILENTNWQIRLLSKSALLSNVAEDLKDYKHRMIFGLSTGTLEDRVAMSFELHASAPSARIRTLHRLQASGYRTYGMICPVLPQVDYAAFAAAAAKSLRVDRCEHVWAEVLNVRGRSLARTCAGLRERGFTAEAGLLENVSGPKNRGAWEEYARATFVALSREVPAEKFRFLQYVQSGTLDWWNQHEQLGAVLLGAHAKRSAEP